MKRMVLGVWLSAAVLTGACGKDDAKHDGSDGGPSRSDAGVTGLCAPSGSGDVSLRGEWAVRASLQVDLSRREGSLVTLCPAPQTAAASLVLHATVAGTDSAPEITAEICDIGLPVASGGIGTCPTDPADNLEIAILLSDALRTFLPMRPLTSPVMLSARTPGASFTANELAFIAGVALANPTDPLPAWDLTKAGCGTEEASPDATSCVAELSRMRDDDGDGHPGVTLEARSGDEAMVLRGKAFVALRVTPRLAGTIRNASCVEGTFDSRLEYSVVGSDLLLSGAQLATPAVIQNIPGLSARPTSTFRMIRADGDGALDFDDDHDGHVSCAEIAAHASAFSR